jgi:8-oxo-dGTP pyrophosphatase MutT (NUDIX family)
MGKPDAVVVVIACNDASTHGRVLGVSRLYDHDDWGLPGGSVDPGETPEQAARRETHEETSLTLLELTKLDEVEYRGRTVHAFVATGYEGEPRASDEGAVAWVSWAELARGTYGDYNRRLFVTHFGAGIEAP